MQERNTIGNYPYIKYQNQKEKKELIIIVNVEVKRL